MKTKRANAAALLALLLFAVGTAPTQAQSVNSGPDRYFIEAIECRGNDHTACDYIRRKLQIGINTSIDDEALQTARLRLSSLPIFESVRLSIEKGSSRGRAILVVEVKESRRITTEVTAGASFQSIERNTPVPLDADTEIQSIAGRLSNQNLFGRQKILDIGVVGSRGKAETKLPYLSRTDYDGYNAKLFYVDPALAGSEKFFLSAGITYSHSENVNTRGFPPTRITSEITTDYIIASASVGYRLWSYSYAVVGYDYQKAENDSLNKFEMSPTTFASSTSARVETWRLGLGWDSEDDAYFPTRGFRLFGNLTHQDPTAGDDFKWNAAYKHTWSTRGGSVWSINIGGEPQAIGDRLQPLAQPTTPDLAFTYARNIQPSDFLGGLERGRWYVQAGGGPFQLRSDGRIGGSTTTAGLKLGIRLDTKVVGVIDLYVAGSKEWVRQ